MQRIALLGGTFDPVHLGHVHIVRSVIERVALDELWILPNASPPHKAQPMLNTELRFHLCEAVFAPYKQVQVKPIELELPLPSYSVHTLRYLRQIMPKAAFLWILGVDAWKNLDQWYQWQDVLQLTNWLVLNRPGYECGVLAENELNTAWQQRREVTELDWNNRAQVFELNIEQHPASSSRIRHACIHNQLDTVEAWLPKIVLQALKNNKLT
ncbi:MAG: nicotinate (nicotinamide) nucleotide adenylyltransferase [Pseudomonadota bacterium]